MSFLLMAVMIVTTKLRSKRTSFIVMPITSHSQNETAYRIGVILSASHYTTLILHCQHLHLTFPIDCVIMNKEREYCGSAVSP